MRENNIDEIFNEMIDDIKYIKITTFLRLYSQAGVGAHRHETGGIIK